MATVNLGRLKPVFKGAYNSGTAYVVDDIVVYSNETYINIQAGTNQQPNTATGYWTKLAAKGTDGTDVGATLTTQGDVLYRDASGLQRLGAGTSGQVLQTGGSGANPSWTNVSSDFVKLASATADGTANSISIDVYFSSTYKRYILMGRAIRNTGGHQSDFQWRVNTGGSVNTTSNYNQTNWYSYTDNTPSHSIKSQGLSEGSVDFDIPARRFEFGGDSMTDDIDTGCDLTIQIFDPQATTKWKNFDGQIWFVRADKQTMQKFNQYSVFKQTTALTGITVQMRSGYIEGIFDLYGIKA